MAREQCSYVDLHVVHEYRIGQRSVSTRRRETVRGSTVGLSLGGTTMGTVGSRGSEDLRPASMSRVVGPGRGGGGARPRCLL
jgi:hypothetical protein